MTTSINEEKKRGPLTQSGFAMWRALFALVHADHVVAPEEVRYMAEVLEGLPFTPEQSAILHDDIAVPKDPIAMFEQISSDADQGRFFKFARELVWVDGRYVQEERDVMLSIEQQHMRSVDFQHLTEESDLGLELEDENHPLDFSQVDSPVRRILWRFRDQFF